MMAMGLKHTPNDLADDARWQVVLTRDRRFDGVFVYAVRSTGVYCRPTCPSRRPQPEQVAFFTTPAGAEAAGFRACLRCRPHEGSPQDGHLELVRTLCRLIEQATEGPPTLTELSAQTGLSAHHLQRVFKTVMGVTPRQYADAHRLSRFKAQVKDGVDVTSSLYEAGYGSSSRLYERAPGQLGMTPASYRRGGQGARIGYTVVDSPLGRLLVAATERGVCAIRLGDDDAALGEGLRREFPAAEVRRAGVGLDEWVRAVRDHLDGQLPHPDLPLDIQATAFQRRVWEELRAIPYGATRSYRQVAEAIGQPRAVRAVARACATNPVALLIPCHRVVRDDGALGGYRWGVERKEALLARERGRAESETARRGDVGNIV